MKTPIRSTLALLVLSTFMGLFVPGCSTTGGGSGTTDWKKFEPMFEVAAYTGTKIYLTDHPDKKPVFVSTVAVLDALVTDPQINVAKLAEALQALPIKELQDPKASIVIGSTIVLWNAYKDRLPLGVQEQAAVVRPLVIRLRNGMGTALGMPTIVAPYAEMAQRMSLPDAQLMQLKRK